jgi:hypothetical protein
MMKKKREEEERLQKLYEKLKNKSSSKYRPRVKRPIRKAQ